jgi:hypothetical protein
MVMLRRKTVLAVKAEATYGTDPTPGASNCIQVKNLDITPLGGNMVSRDLIRPYFGNSPMLLAQKMVQCQFTVELAGSGTAGTAPRYGDALKACALSETVSAGVSVTYAPVSSSFSSATIYYNIDGLLHKVTGARGTVSMKADLGQIPELQFNFTGIYNAPTDTALISPTYANQASPLVFRVDNTSAFQFFSYSGALQSVSLDMGNSIVYRELIGGTKQALPTDRKVAGNVSIEAVAIGTKDYFTAALTDGTTGNLTFQHGTTAGNIVTMTVPYADITQPAYGESDGITMLNIPYVAIPSTSGNDEVSIVLT